MKEKLLLFFCSTQSIVGSLFALGGLGLYFFGFIDRLWFLIVIGCYLIGYGIVPRKRVLVFDFSSANDVDSIEESLERFVKDISLHLPKDILKLVLNIQKDLLSLLPVLRKKESLGDSQIFLVKQMALEYLPTTLQTFVKLPPAFQNYYVKNGQTPKQMVTEQLMLLESKILEIQTNLNENDMQALLANGRFLEEKFKPNYFLSPVS